MNSNNKELEVAVEERDVSSQEDLVGHDPEELDLIRSEARKAIDKHPKIPNKLETFSVVCVICNRMIGTGIFLTPTKVIQYTHSVGLTLVLWLCGAVAAISGILVYMEFGLTTPRYNLIVSGRKQKKSIPRNGGELHYLKDILRKPRFSVACVYGFAFILLGNVAANALSFGIRVLQAANQPISNLIVRVIAIAVVTFACLMHGFWRQGGIYLSNAFAVIKVAMLLLIIVTGFISYSGVFNRPAAGPENFNINTTFTNAEENPFGYAESFLSVLFAYGGFNQANYVMAEVDNPRKKYKWPAFFTVTGVCVLYIFVNIAYFMVVPVKDQLHKDADVARLFFLYTFGTVSTAGTEIAPRVLSAFMAVSSLGNLIVMTYTAARVKQEIAKEGVIPFHNFVSRSYEVNIRKCFNRLSDSIQDETPIGALILHWVLTVLLIIATGAQANPADSYRILVSLYSYVIDAFFGVCLGLGLLFLRFCKSRKWYQKSRDGAGLGSGVSIVAALLFTIANAFPVIASWIPPNSGFAPGTGKDIPWFTTPTVGWSVIVCGVIYWLSFRFVVPHIGKHQGLKLRVQRVLFFEGDQDHPVQTHEQIKTQWVADLSSGRHSGAAEEFVRTRWNGQSTPSL